MNSRIDVIYDICHYLQVALNNMRSVRTSNTLVLPSLSCKVALTLHWKTARPDVMHWETTVSDLDLMQTATQVSVSYSRFIYHISNSWY